MIKQIIINFLGTLGYKIEKIPKYNFNKIYEKYKNHTMVPIDSYIENLKLSRKHSNQLNGDVIECGVWRGGMIAGIASVLGNKHKYFLFDSFEGLPIVTENDGPIAMQWQKNTNSPDYYDNCKAEVSFAKEVMEISGSPYTIIPGWFKNTLPNYNGSIALLRLDADWYDSTMDILINLYPKVITNGIIIIDDYYTWEGCSKAVHDYLSSIKSKSKIYCGEARIAYIIKTEKDPLL